MVDVGGREVVRGLVHPVVVVIIHDALYLVFQLPGQIVGVQVDHVFHGPIMM